MTEDISPEEREYIFLSYQQELMSSTAHYDVTVVEKSRRTGYSWAAGAIAVMKASAQKKAGGDNVFYMGYNLEMAREFIDVCGDWAKKIGHVASEVEEYVFPDPKDPDKEIKAFRIEFASGFKIVALPSSPRSLRGMQGFVIIDEAAFHDDLDELIKAAIALLMWGGKILILSTHNGVDNPYNILIEEIRAGKKPYNLLRCTLDDALKQGLYQRICAVRGIDWSAENEIKWRADLIDSYGDGADEELLCIPSSSGGAYIPSLLVEKCLFPDIPVIRYEQTDVFGALPKHLREAEVRDWCEEVLAPILKELPNDPSYFGYDFARNGDLSVLWPVQEAKSTLLTTPFILELRNMPHQQQEQILFYIVRRLPRFSGGALDARGNGSYLAEVTKAEFQCIEEVQLSQKWYREEMPPFKAVIEDRGLMIPKDRDIRSDFRAIVLEKGIAKPKDARDGDAKGKRHGDSAVAAALAVFATRMEVVEYGYESAGQEPANDPHYQDDLEDEGRRFGAGGF